MGGVMPNWLIPTLKWGGIVVAVVFAVALVVVSGQSDVPAEGAEEAASTAPIVLYWILLIVGVIAAVAGFVLGGRQKASS